MTSLYEAIRKLFTAPKPLAPGVYAYQTPPEVEQPYRLHLRLEPDGQGILIVNAATVLHLNQSAAEFAYHTIQGKMPEQIAFAVAERYGITPSKARDDYQDFQVRLDTLINTPDLDPVSYLDFERQTPYSEVTAPYRLDCALTYRLPAGEMPESAPTGRVKRELETKEWKLIIDKAWQAGIPHVVFTGGEPTLRSDLFELLAHAEKNGMVTGLLSDGLRLANTSYLEQLLQTGLDHLMVVLREEKEQSWQALEQILPADLFTCVHLTINPITAPQIGAVLTRLANMGANAISLSASKADMFDEMEHARQKAAELKLELVWDLPVPYSPLNPVTLETKLDHAPSGAGRAWLYLEPDGDVLPGQGISRYLGNFLSDSWETIWSAAK